MANNTPKETGYQKTIVCLANSRKISGRCIVGKEISKGRIGCWIRPVSNREKGEVSEDERRYEDGSDPSLLDIIQIEFLEPHPQDHQVENHLIDCRYYWGIKGTYPLADVPLLLDDPETLWTNGFSSYSGLNNRVPLGLTGSCSTYLIEPEAVTLLVGPKAPAFSPRRSVMAQFSYQGFFYILDVTDPRIERKYLQLSDGEYIIGSPYLCVSLGEAYSDGFCYKLTAAIIQK